MKSILEDLFDGKINVTEWLPIRKRKSHPDMDSFVKALTSEQQKQYEENLDSLMEQWALNNQDCFMIGFKIAVRMILESVCEINNKNSSD